MKAYWARIVLGALVVFGIGFAMWYAVGRAKDKVQVVVESARPITIPIPLSIIPFRVDGEKYGAVHHVTFHRDAPKSVDRLVVQVKLADSVDAAQFKDCLLSLENVDNIDEHTTFECLKRDAADTAALGLVHFGDVRLDPDGLMVPLLLTKADVADLRHTDEVTLEQEQARLEAAQAEWAADSARLKAEGMADSIRAQVERMVDSLVTLKKVLRQDARPPRPPAPPVKEQ